MACWHAAALQAERRPESLPRRAVLASLLPGGQQSGVEVEEKVLRESAHGNQCETLASRATIRRATSTSLVFDRLLVR